MFIARLLKKFKRVKAPERTDHPVGMPAARGTSLYLNVSGRKTAVPAPASFSFAASITFS